MKKRLLLMLCLPFFPLIGLGASPSSHRGPHCSWQLLGLEQLQQGIVPFHFAYHGSGAEFFFATQRQKEYKLQGREVELLSQIFSAPRTSLPDGSYLLLDIGPGNGLKAAHVASTIRSDVRLQRYVAIDGSESVLNIARGNWASRFPEVQSELVGADIEVGIPTLSSDVPKLALFVGQTLGNVSDRTRVLKNIRASLSNRDRLIVGVELLHPGTPNELSGYSSATNLEIYYSLFKSMGISPENLSPNVRFNPTTNDFEMGFNVTEAFSVAGQSFKVGQAFKAISHRFLLPELHGLLRDAGFCIEDTFLDPSQATALVVGRPL